jgi:hydroxylysine kinase
MTERSSRPGAERGERAALAPPPAGVFGVGSLSDGGARFSAAEAEALAAEHWGIEGTATPIAAEVDQNFRVDADGGSYLLKVVPVEETESLTDLVTAALLHVERHCDVAAQRVVPTREGEPLARPLDGDGAERRARLTTFLEGEIVSGIAVDRGLRLALGAALAELAGALGSFDHPGADRDLSWDIRHAGEMRAMLADLEPGARHEALAAALDRFDAEVSPRLEQLPVQVIHNDLSRDNSVLTSGGEVGVIDFGDIVRTQRINDLAVAVSDHLDGGPDGFAGALDLVEGYLGVGPLFPAELALLYDLTRTRVAMRLVGGEWRAARYPENRAYLARNSARLWPIFEVLPEVPGGADAERLASLIRSAEGGAAG